MQERPYAGRGGLKLERALEVFGLDVAGLSCADFGCSTGGFTDCLLRRGAASVVALDTGYGVLDYRLRTDPRVVVRERTNVLETPVPEPPVDLVVADLSWTRQERLLPVALRWLGGLAQGRVVSLVKPHYEVDAAESKHLVAGVLPDDVAEAVLQRVLGQVPQSGFGVLAWTASPIRGGGKKGRGVGNLEYLALLRPT